jgi:hypothetical protein
MFRRGRGQIAGMLHRQDAIGSRFFCRATHRAHGTGAPKSAENGFTVSLKLAASSESKNLFLILSNPPLPIPAIPRG